MGKNGNGNGDKPIHSTLHKIENEPDKAHGAFLDYVAMGPTRTMRRLLAIYSKQEIDGGEPPTTRWGTLSMWSVKYEWQRRLGDHSNALAVELEGVRKEAVTYFINRALRTAETLFDKLDEQIDQFDRQRVRRSRTVDDPRDANLPDEERRQIRVIEMEVNALELQRLGGTFARVVSQMIDVLGDNDTITIRGPADKIKGYITISPDDWDEEPPTAPAEEPIE